MDAPQTSTFITKSDDPLCNSDHSAPSSDMLLEYDEDGSPLDLGETGFMDLFTESESSQDAGNLVCGCLLPAAHLTHDLGDISCI